MKIGSIISLLLVLASCDTQRKEPVKIIATEVIEEPAPKEVEPLADSILAFIDSCQQQWKSHYPNDSLKRVYINEILSDSSYSLSEANRVFLSALTYELNDYAKKLTVDQVLFPVFRLSEGETGVFGFPKYIQKDDRLTIISVEGNLISAVVEDTVTFPEYLDKLTHYPGILDSIYDIDQRPVVNIFSIDTKGSARIKGLGMYSGECLEYYHYSLEAISLKDDSLLFGSTLDIDLIFKNSIDVDALLAQQDQKCYDCPNSVHLMKTFARIDGTDNLYFAYADTFPLNNELDTPSRALIMVTDNNDIVYLWYSEIDLFGCSCL